MFEFRPIFSALLRHKSQALVLVLQIALTLAIVANATFIIHNRLALMDRPTGLPESQIFKFDFFTFGDDANYQQQIELDEQAIRELPGVIDAVKINQVPISGSGDNSTFSDSADTDHARQITGGVYGGDSHLLHTLGVTLAAGRNFGEDEIIYEDDKQPPQVVIVSKAFIAALFPQLAGHETDGLGKLVYSFDVSFKIIGIVERLQSSHTSAKHIEQTIIFPKVKAHQFGRFLVRTEAGQRQQIMNNVEKLMLSLYPHRVIKNVTSMDDLRARSYADDRMMTQLLLLLVLILFLITAMGIFGSSVFNVNRRTKQIGTRRALGARKRDIIRYFMVENSVLASFGIVIGVALALSLNQYLMQQYDLPKLEYGYLLVTMLAILLLGQLAVLIPARRAALISPAIATRSV